MVSGGKRRRKCQLSSHLTDHPKIAVFAKTLISRQVSYFQYSTRFWQSAQNPEISYLVHISMRNVNFTTGYFLGGLRIYVEIGQSVSSVESYD